MLGDTRPGYQAVQAWSWGGSEWLVGWPGTGTGELSEAGTWHSWVIRGGFLLLSWEPAWGRSQGSFCREPLLLAWAFASGAQPRVQPSPEYVWGWGWAGDLEEEEGLCPVAQLRWDPPLGLRPPHPGSRDEGVRDLVQGIGAIRRQVWESKETLYVFISL